jgi:hypothetical protein
MSQATVGCEHHSRNRTAFRLAPVAEASGGPGSASLDRLSTRRTGPHSETQSSDGVRLGPKPFDVLGSLELSLSGPSTHPAAVTSRGRFLSSCDLSLGPLRSFLRFGVDRSKRLDPLPVSGGTPFRVSLGDVAAVSCLGRS